MGAKQLLPAFLVGLVVRTLWDQVRYRRLQTILLGLMGGGAAILTWFVPLSLHMGGVRAYAAAALSQLASQQEHMAPVFHMVPSRIYTQLQATFVLIWGPNTWSCRCGALWYWEPGRYSPDMCLFAGCCGL